MTSNPSPQPGPGTDVDALLELFDDAGIELGQVQDHTARLAELDKFILIAEAGKKAFDTKVETLKKQKEDLADRLDAAIRERDALRSSTKPRRSFRSRRPSQQADNTSTAVQPAAQTAPVSSGPSARERLRARNTGGKAKL